MEPETDGIEMEIKETTNERIFSSFDMNCMHYALCIAFVYKSNKIPILTALYGTYGAD